MKKVIVILIALMLVTMTAYSLEMTSKFFYTYPVVNNSAATKVTAIPTTSIYPTDRIIGYEVSNLFSNSGNREVYGEVYDSAGGTLSVIDEVLGETESISGDSLCLWFPFPRRLQYGVTVRQGAYTVVTIFFER